jgi:hypothetical protein
LFGDDKETIKDYIRKARKKDLKEFNRFDYEDLAVFGAWRDLHDSSEEKQR